MSEEPSVPETVDITVRECIGKAIAVLERAELIRLDAEHRLELGVPLGDPTLFTQAKKLFDQLTGPLVAVAYAKGIEAQALAEFIRTGDPRLVQSVLTVLDRLQAISLRADHGSNAAQGARLDKTGTRQVAEANDLPDRRPATSARSASGATTVPTASAGLPPAQQKVWDLLEGRVLLGKQIAHELCGRHDAEDAIRKRIASIRKNGRKIENRPGLGYYRPDAPPTEWTGAECESG